MDKRNTNMENIVKIKSLLLGSAAALVAVSGAQAADAIIVEPEPVEYVRVCDAYGSGFFYIPGTETCMRISGYVRSTYRSTHHSQDLTQSNRRVDALDNGIWINNNIITTANGQVRGNPIGGLYLNEQNSGGHSTAISNVRYTQHGSLDTHDWDYRGRLNIDVRNETEWGTLRSQLRIQGGDSNAQDVGAVIDRALISVGGFRLGYSDSFTTTHHGYGYHRAINDGFYSYDQAIFFDYTWAANGWSVTVGVQDSESAGAQFSNSGGIADFYAGFKYSGSWGNIAVSAIHDGRAWDEYDATKPVFGTDDFWRINQGAWTWRASFDLDLSEYFAGGAIRGWYAGSETPYNNTIGYCGGADAHVPCDHEWGVSMQASLGDNLNGYVGYSAVAGDDDLNGLSYDAWSAAVGLVWAPITGLTIQTEYSFTDSEHKSHAGVYYDRDGGTSATQVDKTADIDVGTFKVRITRSW